MTKYLFPFLFVLLLIPLHAQASDNQFDSIALVQKVDSLNHELIKIKLNTDLSELSNNLSSTTNRIGITANTIQLYVFQKMFDKVLLEAYESSYESYKNNVESSENLILTMTKTVYFSIATHNFTEDEAEQLFQRLVVINNTLNALKSSLKVFRISLDMYKKLE